MSRPIPMALFLAALFGLVVGIDDGWLAGIAMSVTVLLSLTLAALVILAMERRRKR